jgi:peptidoglycan L-alanyl-D-glutamate endopeptidase CwlK
MARWEWPLIWPIAHAVDQAATKLGVGIVWGTIWDKPMSAYGGGIAQLKAEVEAYKKRHAGADFLDGPHYQLAGGAA